MPWPTIRTVNLSGCMARSELVGVLAVVKASPVQFGVSTTVASQSCPSWSQPQSWCDVEEEEEEEEKETQTNADIQSRLR